MQHGKKKPNSKGLNSDDNTHDESESSIVHKKSRISNKENNKDLIDIEEKKDEDLMTLIKTVISSTPAPTVDTGAHQLLLAQERTKQLEIEAQISKSKLDYALFMAKENKNESM